MTMASERSWTCQSCGAQLEPDSKGIRWNHSEGATEHCCGDGEAWRIAGYGREPWKAGRRTFTFKD
jgi:hypothetical protein